MTNSLRDAINPNPDIYQCEIDAYYEDSRHPTSTILAGLGLSHPVAQWTTEEIAAALDKARHHAETDDCELIDGPRGQEAWLREIATELAAGHDARH